jgi:hypothetical protein
MIALVAVIAVGAAGLTACSGDMKKQDDMSMSNGCPQCEKAMMSDAGGWCDHCGVGHYRGETTKCEGCLKAMQTDGTCPACGVTYENGKKVM